MTSNGYQNKSQHRKLTLEKKIIPPPPPFDHESGALTPELFQLPHVTQLFLTQCCTQYRQSLFLLNTTKDWNDVPGNTESTSAVGSFAATSARVPVTVLLLQTYRVSNHNPKYYFTCKLTQSCGLYGPLWRTLPLC